VALELAQAPETVIAPFQADPNRLEAAAQTVRSTGQRLDAARAAVRKAEAKAEAAASTLAAAVERNEKANEDKAARAADLAAL